MKADSLRKIKLYFIALDDEQPPRPIISQFQILKIRRWINFLYYKNVNVRNVGILTCEMVDFRD